MAKKYMKKMIRIICYPGNVNSNYMELSYHCAPNGYDQEKKVTKWWLILLVTKARNLKSDRY